MNLIARIDSFFLRLLCIVLLVAAFPVLAEAAVAGRFQFVAGTVRIADAAGKERIAKKGDDVSEGETILTAADSSAQLKMIDGAMLALRPDTQLKLDEYTYNGKEDGSENAVFSLVKGGLRAISGLIGRLHKEKYKVRTPSATIGIRGTDHETVVVLAPAAGATAINPAGTYDKVNVGATVLTNQAGTKVINPNQVGFAASATQVPVILPTLPDFFKVTFAPSKKAQKQQDKEESPRASARETKAKEETQAAGGVVERIGNLTGTDADGNRLNLSAQTVTTASGQSLVLNATTLSKLANSTAGVITGYSSMQTVDSSLLATVNSMVSTTQAKLSNLQTQLDAGNTASTTALAALSSGNSAISTGNNLRSTAISAGANINNPGLFQQMDSILQLSQSAMTSATAACNGVAGTSGGAIATLTQAGTALQVATRLLTNTQTLLASNTDTTRQEYNFSRLAAQDAGSQLSSLVNGLSDAASAKNLAAQAVSAADAAVAGFNIPNVSPYYTVAKNAVLAAQQAANAAKSAADAAYAAALAASGATAFGKTLADLATNLQNNQFYALPFGTYYAVGGSGVALARNGSGHFTGAIGTNIDLQTNVGSGGTTDSTTSGSGSANIFGSVTTFSQSGSTLTDLGQHGATGLSWGRWQGGQVTQTQQILGIGADGVWALGAMNSAGVFVPGAGRSDTTTLGAGSLHWIAGTGPAVRFLPQVLTGTADYALIGGTRPTDQLGNVGTLNSANVKVNFSTQQVKAQVNFSIAGNVWDLQSGDMQLDRSGFSSRPKCSGAGSCTSNVTLTRNGNVTPTSGTGNAGFAHASLNGSLMGQSLNGASLLYSVTEASPKLRVDPLTGISYTTFSDNVIQGVGAFSGPAQDVASLFRIAAMANAWGEGQNSYFVQNSTTLDTSGLYRGSIEGSDQLAAKIVDSASGLTEFAGAAKGYTPVVAGTTVPNLSDPATLATIKLGTAVNRDVGSANIAGTTISWGRWEGGNVDIYSRDGTTKLGSIDNSNRSMHWITTSNIDSSFAKLPLTGTATYALAGATSPTDLIGNVGTLGAVSLNADFANAKINAALAVSFNSATNTSNWNMTANNIPIRTDDGFKSNTGLTGANGIVHTATCTGNCGPQTAGYINGNFFGNGQGAVVNYGMITGSQTGGTTGTFTPSNGVTGMAVMKKN